LIKLFNKDISARYYRFIRKTENSLSIDIKTSLRCERSLLKTSDYPSTLITALVRDRLLEARKFHAKARFRDPRAEDAAFPHVRHD